MNQPADDYDTPWKSAVMGYFREFMAFFFPQAHDAIDWRQPHSFLDQELAQVVRDAGLGRRRLDKLVQVAGRDGAAGLLYIHIEIQRSREKGFAERIFTYHYRIYDRFRSPVSTLVILADPHPGWRPDSYRYDMCRCETSIIFPVAKLLDYWPRLDRLLASPNAFALLTAAHLMTLRTRGQDEQRFEFKAMLTALLYQRQWDAQRVLDLFNVLDWMMKIPGHLQNQLALRIDELNRSNEMPFENLMIRMAKDKARKDGLQEGWEVGLGEGREQGLELGREEGRQEGRRALVRKLLRLRFGPLPPSAEQRIAVAGTAELTALEDKILQAASLDELIQPAE
ncbi:hypothetical protein ASC94_09520 [Massilia sp. Root418]|uniref:DUF4351 domain-containing protein n=1 Tax=Massilia sp. Root418 TaxID=1736532 RepID=UPI0006F37ADC|nr:DUF4351 domain-containing protein [Massilia sp. Root418]KQW97030.1 hypothetical protein ASC94_09520 [Massilia sp. Root418]